MVKALRQSGKCAGVAKGKTTTSMWLLAIALMSVLAMFVDFGGLRLEESRKEYEARITNAQSSQLVSTGPCFRPLDAWQQVHFSYHCSLVRHGSAL